ncbi:MAG: ion transporter [Methanotrichaceae archaeon]|nr:ion transporter [Methanotrichaceae archaeon]
MTNAGSGSNEKGLGYEIFIGLLAIISIIDLVLMAIPSVSSSTKQVLSIIQAFLTIFFLIDFFYRFFTTQSKKNYFLRDYGWADLLSCWPSQGLRLLRVFRLAKVYRLLKNYGSKRIISEIIDNRAEMAIYIIVVLVVVVLQLGAVWEIRFEENNPDANIKTGADALWWGFVTITTVGYGDKYPTTSGGRLIGVALMVCGVGIFSTFAGFIANSFLAPRKKKEEEAIAEPSDPRTKVAEMKKMLEEQEKTNADLKSRLEEMEKIL